MGIIKSVLLLLVGAALAIFMWSNYEQRVVIKFTSSLQSVELSLSSALVLALLVGFLLAVVLSLPNQFRLRRRVRELRRRIDQLDGENAELRRLPLPDDLDSDRSGPGSGSGSGSGAEASGRATELSGPRDAANPRATPEPTGG